MNARALGLVLLAATLAACTSPEATRTRAGGPGGDVGNRQPVVEMHEGSEPYWQTPRRLADEVTATPRTAARSDEPGREGPPAASPR